MIDLYDQIGREAAHEAGRFILDRFRSNFTVFHKGAVDLVTDVDIAAERLIVSRILKAFPDHSVLAEEMYPHTRRSALTWIIDPLDGTTNYAHGYPVFAVSIGLEISGVLEWGVVFNPVLDETFTARRGCGACCNDISIHVSKTDSLGNSLLATGFPYDIQTTEQNNLDHFCSFALRARGIRRGGSAALDLSYVAAGRLDGYWEIKLHPWDCAAGYLVVREAGGSVTNFKGRPGSIYDREVVASNGLIHREMLALL